MQTKRGFFCQTCRLNLASNGASYLIKSVNMCSSNCDEDLFPTRHFPRNLCRILSKPATNACETNKNRWTWHGNCFLATFRSKVPGPYLWMILLMAEIVHHLGCINPTNNGINHQPQLVQDFSHQQYIFTFFCGCLFEDGLFLFFSAGTGWVWKTVVFFWKKKRCNATFPFRLYHFVPFWEGNLWLEFVAMHHCSSPRISWGFPKMEGVSWTLFTFFFGVWGNFPYISLSSIQHFFGCTGFLHLRYLKCWVMLCATPE